MEVCERCGANLRRGDNAFLRCAECGLENDEGGYEFACGDASDAECELCEERMCRHAGAAVG